MLLSQCAMIFGKYIPVCTALEQECAKQMIPINQDVARQQGLIVMPNQKIPTAGIELSLHELQSYREMFGRIHMFVSSTAQDVPEAPTDEATAAPTAPPFLAAVQDSQSPQPEQPATAGDNDTGL